jgi:transcriptional regulator with XRE-family HTH domain
MIDIVKFINATKATQVDLADKLGVSQTAISMVKNGKLEIPKLWIDIIEKEYKININDFIINSDNISNNITSEPKEEYSTSVSTVDKMVEAIFEIIQSNQKLIDNNTKLIETNSDLSQFLIQKLNEM